MDQATGLREMIRGEAERIRTHGTDNDERSSSTITRPRIIAISSGKGGVGKTNVVGNLAVACQRMGKRVLIFDADLGLANIDIIFGINPTHTIEEVIRGEKELSQIIVKGPEGVSLIPASSGMHELTHLTEGQKIHLLVRDEREAKSVYQNLSKVVARFMGRISIDYAGFIPWDSLLQEAVTRRKLVVCCSPETSSAASFKELACNLLMQKTDRANDGNIKFFWKRLMTGPAE
jgi:MinD-like ATPase involved in chromosome partitioning or flagellar assembly